MPFLKYTDPLGVPQTVELAESELTIGRDAAACQVVLGKRYASRKHARLFKRGTSWVIADLGSSHGTFVNRLRVTGEIVRPGQHLFLIANPTAGTITEKTP